MIKQLLVGIIIMYSTGVTAHTTVGAGYYKSNDTDAATQTEPFIYSTYTTESYKILARTGRRSYTDTNGSTTLTHTKMGYDRHLTSDAVLSVELGSAHNSKWSPVIGSVSLIHKPNDQVRFEVIMDVGIVDSILAISNKTKMTTVNATVDYNLTHEITVSGNMISQQFSDDNKRSGYGVRLIYSPTVLDGWNFQLKHKNLKTDHVSSLYFSPDSDVRNLFSVGYAKAINDKWVIRTHAGAGYRDVNDNSQSIYEYGINVTKSVSDAVHGRFAIDCVKDSSNQNYRYCWGGMSIGASF